MNSTIEKIAEEYQNLQQNPSNAIISKNNEDLNNDTAILMSSRSIMQIQEGQSGVKLDLDKKQNICKKYRKFVIIGIVVIFLIAVGLGLLFGFSNENFSGNTKKIYDSSHNTRDPSEYFDLVKLNTTSALCIDGTPAPYYISRNGNSQKILLFFEGGAWCADKDYSTTMQNCYQRTKKPLGSSKYHERSVIKNQGIFSRDERNYFKDWKKVLLSYCDGMGHQGTRKQPIQFNGKLLYFRGHDIAVEQLQALQQKIGLFSNATQIVVGGQSAGGLASLLWVNYIAERAHKAKVVNLPSSGIFYDSFNSQFNSYYYREIFKNVVNITNQEIDSPIPECIKEYPNNKQNCHFAQYIYKYIKVPMFVIQSLYDTWCISDVLGLKCTDPWSIQSLFTCTPTQVKLIEQHQTAVFNLLQQISLKNNNSVWGISCPAHNLVMNSRFYSADYRIPEGSSNSMNEAIKGWIEKTTSNNVYLDSTHWPGNYACSGMK